MIETYIDASGWHIALWDRKGQKRGRTKLELILNTLDIDFHYFNNDRDSDKNFLVLEDFNHDISYEEIKKGILRAMNYARNINL